MSYPYRLVLGFLTGVLMGLVALILAGCAGTHPVYVCMASKSADDTPVLVCGPYEEK